jgi:hypothetical protein
MMPTQVVQTLQPIGNIKAFVLHGFYILFLDFDDDITQTATKVYSAFADSEEALHILDTGIRVDLNCFQWLITDIMKSYAMHRYTFTDIVHILTHAMAYYKKRAAFLGVCSTRSIPFVPLPTSTENNDMGVFTIENYTLKKKADVLLSKAALERFKTMALSDIFYELRLYTADDAAYHFGC